MKMKMLLPRRCKLIGAVLLPFAIAWLVAGYFGDHTVFPFLKYGKQDALGSEFIFSKGFGTDFNGELSILATLACLFMMAFSREKEEDEYISTVRLHALQVSVYVNYIILALSSILFYGFSYIIVLQTNLFTILITFILVFNYNLHFKQQLFKSGQA